MKIDSEKVSLARRCGRGSAREGSATAERSGTRMFYLRRRRKIKTLGEDGA
jgi:hypothetical protein